METDETTRAFIRERYASIATGRPLPVSASCCSSTELSSFVEQGYTEMEGYAKEADLSLGCGIPTAHAGLRPGEVVLDLGSGAGNDAFIASRAVGASGKVIGVDMTSAMIAKADENAAKLGAKNVEFRLGEIEHLPVRDATVDVILSNCVINLSPDKPQVWREIARVLKPGGLLIATTNGADALKELTDLTQAVFGPQPKDFGHASFSLETGEPILKRHFREVTVHPAADILRVTDAQDVVNYVCSFPPGDGAPEPLLAKLKSELAARMAAQGGIFAVTRIVGYLVARRPRR